MSTDYHAKYWAHMLTLQASSASLDKLTRPIASARVDLNPHQIDAALFAFRSPLSQGAILADEVGLGKTIEAGIVISQRWAERRRKVLLILPAALRKQWQQELEEKFSLPTQILESGTFNRMMREEECNPFEMPNCVVICSYHFAAAKADYVARVPWDLVVIDEAHRLRNVYKPGNKMAAIIRDAIGRSRKLLVTATPLQNSLMELYGLVSIIDPLVFGDAGSFGEQYIRDATEHRRNQQLRERLKPVVTRTLRKQVLEYIRYTQRIPITQEFLPSDAEQQLYDNVTAYLQRDVLLALPASQRALITLVLRKLLASSTFAIAGTLRSLIRRLEGLETDTDGIRDDFESFDEIADEWEEEAPPRPRVDQALLAEELRMLREYANLAESIHNNAKGGALLKALREAFDKTRALGAAEKAVIFTESRRTQQYLLDLLSANGYAGQIVLFNGTNTDPQSRAIYQAWLERHAGEAVITNSRTADMRAALIEEFRDRAKVLIATESAAEGVNLQFCSLVVNYDLPWNPQRIEQRIGRCHRYGQKHDVVVVNFLNSRNAADVRVHQLLSEKFQLFNGVFGASDEVLGAVESGVDIEKRIAEMYQEARTPEEIDAAFDQLQSELEVQIQSRMLETRRALLDNFDEDVHARLKVHENDALAKLSELEQTLLALTKTELAGEAEFCPDAPRFSIRSKSGLSGRYNLDWREAERLGETFFHVEHPLAQRIIEKAAGRQLPVAEVELDYTRHGTIISTVQPLVGTRGWLKLSKLSVESLETEESLLLAGTTDSGERLDEEVCRKLLSLSGRVAGLATSRTPTERLDGMIYEIVRERIQAIDERNARFFDEEVAKLDAWSDDLKVGLERELRDLDRKLKEARREARVSSSLAKKLAAQKALKEIEARRTKKRRELYDAQDEIDNQRDELIAGVEAQLKQSRHLEELFTIRWRVV